MVTSLHKYEMNIFLPQNKKIDKNNSNDINNKETPQNDWIVASLYFILMLSAPGHLVLQQRAFQDQHPCLHHCYAGDVHSQQLYSFKTANNINNQVHWHLDHLWIVSSFCHHHPACADRASSWGKQPCVCWKYKKCRNSKLQGKRCHKIICKTGFTNSRNCFHSKLFSLCFDNIYLLKGESYTVCKRF